MKFNSPNLSLADLLGKDYIDSVVKGNVAFGVMTKEEADALAYEKIDFYPEEMQKKNVEFAKMTGTKITDAFENDNDGAATNAFKKAFHKASAPVTGYGCTRLGEDGRLYLIGKSEHYHVPFGHRFGGYKLIENAHRLGILNPTHNNTRGYVTRLVEREMIRTANCLEKDDKAGLEKVLASTEPKVINRVINLETGSVACEAGMKMMLARFYRLDGSFEKAKYEGKTPVFLVNGDVDGGIEANYHGTSVFAQTLRNLWPGYYKKIEEAGIYKVVPVMLNDIEDFKAKMKKYNEGNYKTAGYIHELILMNYGGIRLTKEYVQEAYKICKEYDTPTMDDEIQSCMWYPGMYLYHLYEIEPDFVIVGKGFPGGEYPASKILTTAEMDILNQFGALVTNGQEELASLAYLITMTFSQANTENIARLSDYFEQSLRKLGEKYSSVISKVEGQGLLAAIHFHDVPTAAECAKIINEHCIDTSAQLYKVNCPPAILLKPPVTACEEVLDVIINALDAALGEL